MLSDVRHTFFNGNSDYFRTQLQEFVAQFGMDSDDLKNLSISALIAKMLAQAEDGPLRQQLVSLLDTVRQAGLGNTPSAALNLVPRHVQTV